MGIILYVFSGLIAFNLFNIPEMEDLLKITAICYPFIALHKVAIGTLNGLHKIKKYALLDITLNGLILAVSVFFVMVFDLGTQGAVYGFVLPTIFVSIFSFSSIKNYMTRHIEYNNVFRDLTWFGFYVVISGSVGMLYHHVDSLMLGYFMSETDVGHYAIAAIFIQGLALIPNAVQKITTPRIAYHYGKKDYDQILQLIKNVLLKTYAITFIIFVFLVLSGKYLIIFLFTDDFLPAYIPLVILLIGYAINAPIGSIGGILGSIGKINISFRIAVLTSLINVIANFLLIPKHGLIGAASATSLSFILGTIIYYLVVKRIIRNWT
jgi:O-antigen/teichoic acid export membrane protein